MTPAAPRLITVPCLVWFEHVKGPDGMFKATRAWRCPGKPDGSGDWRFLITDGRGVVLVDCNLAGARHLAATSPLNFFLTEPTP